MFYVVPDVDHMKRDLAALVAINTENLPSRESETAELITALLEDAGFDLSFSEHQTGCTSVIAVLKKQLRPLLHL